LIEKKISLARTVENRIKNQVLEIHFRRNKHRLLNYFPSTFTWLCKNVGSRQILSRLSHPMMY